MSVASDNNRRIAKNTFFLYGRMLFSMVVSLYTTRVLLQTLGEVDFGLFSAIGGFVVMFSVLSAGLSTSVSRFMTFELGRGDLKRLNQIFSTSLVIHLALAVIISLLLETVGLWFLNHRMTIPPDRIVAANWVYHSAVASFIIGVMGVSYTALITAHERMDIFAYLGMGQVILHLILVLILSRLPGHYDTLALYAIFNLLIAVLVQLYTWWYCRTHFVEATFRRFFEKTLFRNIGSFAGWNITGSFAYLSKEQGVNTLLNIYGGPVINAARGIGGNVNGAVVKFSSSFMTALDPQIIKSYALGDYKYLFTLVERGSRFAFYAMFVLALPIFIETDTVLSIWLGEYPPHAVNFARLFIMLTMIDILSSTLNTLQLATGKVKKYQLIIGGVTILNFPISFLTLSMGYSPESTMYVAMFITAICLLLRLWLLNEIVAFPILGYLRRVILNVITIGVLSTLIPVVLYVLFHDINVYLRLFLILGSSTISTSVVVLYVGCNKNERNFLLTKARQIILKVFGKKD